MGLEKSGSFEAHPSNGDRIRAARRANEPVVFRCNLRATMLFTNFELSAKQVTILHYSDDLEIPLGLARPVLLQPISKPSAEPREEFARRKMPGIDGCFRQTPFHSLGKKPVLHRVMSAP